MNSYESLWLIRFPWRMPLLPLRNKANSIAKIMSIWVKFGFRGLFLVCEGNPSQTRNSPRKPILTHIDTIFAKQLKFVGTTLVNRDIGNGTASYKWMLSSCVSARLSEIAGSPRHAARRYMRAVGTRHVLSRHQTHRPANQLSISPLFTSCDCVRAVRSSRKLSPLLLSES